MDPLLPSLLTALTAEIGDKTQLLVVLLAARFARPAAVFAGITLGALVNALLAAYAGALLHDMVGDRALALFLALALITIGLGGFWPQKTEDTARDWKLGAFATSAVAFVILEFGDKTQFATAAYAARSEAPLLAAIGATLGVAAANLPAAVLGPRLPELVPLRIIRWGISAIILTIGAIVALDALRLI